MTIWRRRREISGIAIAAIMIVCGNLVALSSLPWSQATLFGDVDPAFLLSVGLLLQIALMSFALFKTFRELQGDPAGSPARIGPYLLKEKIGAGGMGEVYRAEHQLMRRECAIKLINRNQAHDRDMRESFEQEAKATAQLTHWNTVEVYDYGTSQDGRFYYVMEYLQGVNLSEFVEKYGPMPAARVSYILKQLCEALYEAECIGLVHRDIKPSNIFLTERGRSFDVAKLLDFGLVQAVTSESLGLHKVSTKLRGSPAYMCPEQAVGLNPDCRGDLYSLGCVAYFLLTGRPPFTDENPIMLIVAHATTDVPTFEELNVAVPEDFANVILKCLKRNPNERYQSSRHLLDDLESCQCGNEWTWKCADQWWNKYQPHSVYEEPNPEESETMQLLNRDTKNDTMNLEGQLSVTDSIDHVQETVIYEPVEVAPDQVW